MKATFALLANHEVHNFVRKISWDIHQKYNTGTKHASLPPHISLKQTFSVSELSTLELYMLGLAKSIQPFDVTLTELQVIPISSDGKKYGILWIDVQETKELRMLHSRLNTELNQQFGNTPADFDGDSYRFHMTVMMGGQSFEVYQKYLNELPTRDVDLSFRVHKLGLFVYDESPGSDGNYLCYKILTLG